MPNAAANFAVVSVCFVRHTDLEVAMWRAAVMGPIRDLRRSALNSKLGRGMDVCCFLNEWPEQDCGSR